SPPSSTLFPYTTLFRSSATKHNFLVKDGKDLAPIIKEAFHIAATGRPGPVHVDLPKDILVKEWTFEYPERVHLRSYNPTYEGHRSEEHTSELQSPDHLV